MIINNNNFKLNLIDKNNAVWLFIMYVVVVVVVVVIR